MKIECSYEWLDPKFKDRLQQGYNAKYHLTMGRESKIPECCIQEFIKIYEHGNWLTHRVQRGCLKYLGGPIWIKVDGTWRFCSQNFARTCDCIEIGYILCNRCHTNQGYPKD